MHFIDIQPILDTATQLLSACGLGDSGAYSRTPGGEKDLLATAAAVNLQYILGTFPGHSGPRETWINELRSPQDKTTGLLHINGQPDPVATASCAAALECFDMRLSHTPHSLMAYADPVELPLLLDKLPWEEDPAAAGTFSAAVYTLLTLGDEASHHWEDAWFHWFNRAFDEHTGLVKHGCISPVILLEQYTLFPHLQGLFPLLTAYNAARMPHPFPWRLIDTILDMLESNWSLFSRDLEARELPLIYSLSRSMRITPHRQEECQQTLRRFAHRWLRYLKEQAQAGHMNDLVITARDLCAIAELQQILPGYIRTRRSLRQVLNRRPFL
jgi:hypothetical protein